MWALAAFPKVPQLDCFLVRLACGSESSPQADMILNPIQLQTEKTIWSNSMLEPPNGALGSDVLFLEKQKKGGKNVICQKWSTV